MAPFQGFDCTTSNCTTSPLLFPVKTPSLQWFQTVTYTDGLHLARPIGVPQYIKPFTQHFLTSCSNFHWQEARNNIRPPDTAERRWKVLLSFSYWVTNNIIVLLLYSWESWCLHFRSFQSKLWSYASALLRSFPNFKLVMSRHGKELCRAPGLGLCVNPSQPLCSVTLLMSQFCCGMWGGHIGVKTIYYEN